MKMKILMLTLLTLFSTANAGIYSDDMARCLVSSTSTADKTDLVRWMFATIAVHPDVASLITVPDAKREELDKKVATLFERLVTDTCQKQSREAMKYEGAIAFQQSFGLLGQVATQELMTNNDVAAGFQGFTKYLDKAKFEALNAK